MKTVSKEEVDYFVGNLSFVARQYHLFLLFKEKISFLPSPQFAKVIISSLARGFLLSLAALLDQKEDSWGNKNFSIYIFDEATEMLKTHSETIQKLKNIRDKLLAHNDYEVFKNSDEFLKNLNHTVEASKALLDEMVLVVTQEANSIDPSNVIQKIFNTDIPSECKTDINTLIK